MNGCRIAVIGATGAVGRVFLRILEERSFPIETLRLCASERSIGRSLTVNGREHIVEPVTEQLLGEIDVVFISANSGVSRDVAPVAARLGAIAIDDSSAFRMDPTVPLVVPEVNADDLRGHRGIVAIPNCTTTPLVMALKPLHDLNPVTRMVVATYQSVTGTGAPALEELMTQSRQVLDGRVAEARQYPHQIAFNVLPQVESFTDNGYSAEEMKIVDETRKIMHAPEIQISSTCVRVPVAVSHSAAVHVEFAHPIEPGDVREILSGFPGVTVVDDPHSSVYPMPIDAEGHDAVFVGRIRRDISHPNGIAMWIVADNLRKGAGLNAIQIAEEILSRELLPAPGRRI